MLNAKNFNRQHRRAAIQDMIDDLLFPYMGNMDRRTLRRCRSTKGKGKFLKEYVKKVEALRAGAD